MCEQWPNIHLVYSSLTVKEILSKNAAEYECDMSRHVSNCNIEGVVEYIGSGQQPGN